MRTVIVASLFFCATLCLSMLPVISKSAINSVENQRKLYPSSTTTSTTSTTAAPSTSSTTTTTTTSTTTSTTLLTTSETTATTDLSTPTPSTPQSPAPPLAPYLVMRISEATYLVIIIPAVMIVNAFFVFAIYYLPLRQLFYKIERYLQALSKIRSGAINSPYFVSNSNTNNNNNNNNNSTILTSAMVDTEGCRARHRQTEEEIKAAQKRQRKRERKRLARARKLARMNNNNNNCNNSTDPQEQDVVASSSVLCKKSFHDELIDLGIDDEELNSNHSSSDRFFNTMIQMIQLRDVEEHCAGGHRLLQRAKALLEDRAEKLEEIARLEAKLGKCDQKNDDNTVEGTGNGESSPPPVPVGLNPIDIHMTTKP